MGFVFVGEQQVQWFFEIGEQILEIVIVVVDFDQVVFVVECVEQVVGEGVDVVLWFEVDIFFFLMGEFMDSFVYVWVVIVFFVLLFGFVNILVMVVFECVCEIGLMLVFGVMF